VVKITKAYSSAEFQTVISSPIFLWETGVIGDNAAIFGMSKSIIFNAILSRTKKVGV